MRKWLTKFSWIIQFLNAERFLQSRVLVAPSGYMLRIIGIYFLTQCSPYSHCQSSVHGAPSFRYSSRPRCFAAAWWFRLRGRELRPEDACQKRFSWFSDWSPKVQKFESFFVFLFPPSSSLGSFGSNIFSKLDQPTRPKWPSRPTRAQNHQFSDKDPNHSNYADPAFRRNFSWYSQNYLNSSPRWVVGLG